MCILYKDCVPPLFFSSLTQIVLLYAILSLCTPLTLNAIKEDYFRVVNTQQQAVSLSYLTNNCFNSSTATILDPFHMQLVP